MEIHQLRYFVAVAEQEGFSRAAEHCHVAQPSLSQQIQRLERELGHRLFDRLGRRTVLTEAGRAFLPRARRVLEELREAREALAQDLESGQGPLAVGAIPTMAPFLLPPVLERFRQDYPACELTVREDLTERLVEAVAASEIDFAIASTPVDHLQIEVEVVGRERLLLATSRHGTAPPLRLTDLSEQPTVVLYEVHCLGRQIRELCSLARVQPRIVCRGTQLSTVQQMVALGMGVSLVPEMCARADASSTLRYQQLSGEQPEREISVLWRKGRSRSALARSFVAALGERLAAGLHRSLAEGTD